MNIKTDSPLFSIIIPTYNRGDLISKAIQSVIDQTFENWELIVIDDGSTDNTRKVVANLIKNDKRINYIYQKNSERSAARNKGARHAKAKWICFLDSDDIYKKNHLMTLKNEIKGGTQPTFFFTLKKEDLNNNLSQLNIIEEIFISSIHSQQVCIHKNILDEFNFNEKLNIGEDKELWLRIAMKYPVQKIPKITVKICDHDERSVNISNINSSVKNFKVVNNLSKKYINHISGHIIKREISNCYFRIAKSYLYNDKKIQSLPFLIKAVLVNVKNKQTKHRIYLIFLILIWPKSILLNQYCA